MRLLILIFSLVISCSLASAETIEIKLPIAAKEKNRHSYQIGLIKLAMEKAGVPYKIKFQSRTWAPKLATSMLKKGKRINLYWMGTSKTMEQELLPIRIPIYRGLSGYRVFIINKKNQSRFDNVQQLEDLQKMVGVQEVGWSDNYILKEAGLKTFVSKYRHIFKVINHLGNADYFSRGVYEAFKEVKQRKRYFPNLTIEKRILLAYPTAMFFFTSPENTELSELLEKGLQLAYGDGSFIKYFNQHPHIQMVFQKADLENRLRLELPNPFLSEETAMIPAEYWHDAKISGFEAASLPNTWTLSALPNVGHVLQ